MASQTDASDNGDARIDAVAKLGDPAQTTPWSDMNTPSASAVPVSVIDLSDDDILADSGAFEVFGAIENQLCGVYQQQGGHQDFPTFINFLGAVIYWSDVWKIRVDDDDADAWLYQSNACSLQGPAFPPSQGWTNAKDEASGIVLRDVQSQPASRASPSRSPVLGPSSTPVLTPVDLAPATPSDYGDPVLYPSTYEQAAYWRIMFPIGQWPTPAPAPLPPVVDPMPQPLPADQLIPPPPAGLVTQFSVTSMAYRVKWTIQKTEHLLRSNDKLRISPEFYLSIGSERNAKFKIMLRPRTVVLNNNSREGFNRSRGEGAVELKCECSFSASEALVSFRVFIGDGDTLQIARGPVRHNFSDQAVARLPKDHQMWNLRDAMDGNGNLMICIEIVPNA